MCVFIVEAIGDPSPLAVSEALDIISEKRELATSEKASVIINLSNNTISYEGGFMSSVVEKADSDGNSILNRTAIISHHITDRIIA